VVGSQGLTDTRALRWIIEDTCQATIDDANAPLPSDAETTLLDVASTEPERLARAARRGRVEREVVAAADGMDILVLARGDDRERLTADLARHHARAGNDPAATLRGASASLPAAQLTPWTSNLGPATAPTG
jgi:hypothetical protein